MLSFAKTVLVLAVCLVVADIVGVIACTVFDILPLRGNSFALPYAIWFVLGVFCGMIALNGAGGWIAGQSDADWSARPEGKRIATLVLASSAVVLVLLSVLFYVTMWATPLRAEFYVPDSMPHTLVFFLAVLGAMVLARTALMPKPSGDGAR